MKLYKYTKPTRENHNYGHPINIYRGHFSQKAMMNDIENYHHNFSYFTDKTPNTLDKELFSHTIYGINNLILSDGTHFKQHYTEIQNQEDFDIKVVSLIRLISFFEEGYDIAFGHTGSDFWGLLESGNFTNKTFLMLYVYLCLSKYSDIGYITNMAKNYSYVFIDSKGEYRDRQLGEMKLKLGNISELIIEVASQPQYKQAILDYYTYYAESQKMPLDELLNSIDGWYERSLLEQILQLTKDED